MNNRLSEIQRLTVGFYVHGQVVHDLGAGDLTLAHDLLALGATRVVAIDRHLMPTPRDPRIETIVSYFHEIPAQGPLKVAFLSWPVNWYVQGMLDLVKSSEICVYLGKNTDYTACGFPQLFQHFVSRRCLAYIPDRRNCLLILGADYGGVRDPHGEELAGLNPLTVFGYEQAEELSHKSDL